MSDDRLVFLDTNILVYAHDEQAGEKHRLARETVRQLWNRAVPPVISVQVLQELYVNLIRKQIPQRQAREIVSDYLNWTVIPNDAALLLRAIDNSSRFRISFWDALIISAADRADVDVVWSEDLNAGQDYGGVTVVNPLA